MGNPGENHRDYIKEKVKSLEYLGNELNAPGPVPRLAKTIQAAPRGADATIPHLHPTRLGLAKNRTMANLRGI
jgi:hypothetical protein